MIASRRTADRVAAWVVRGGGAGVVMAVLLIAVFLVLETVPLTRKPVLGVEALVASAPPPVVGGVEPFVEAAWILDEDGSLSLVDLNNGELLERDRSLNLRDGERVVQAKVEVAQQSVVALTSRGRIAELALAFVVDYDAELNRSHSFDEIDVRWLLEEESDVPIRDFAFFDHGRGFLVAVVDETGGLRLVRANVKRSLVGGESIRRESSEVPVQQVTHVAFLEGGRLVAAVEGGGLHGFDRDLEPRGDLAGEGAVRILQPLIGSGSVLVGREDGSLERCVLEPQTVGPPRLSIGHRFTERVEGLRQLVPSPRTRVFATIGGEAVGIGQATVGRLYENFSADTAGWWAMSPREDHLVAFRPDRRVAVFPLDLGYPGVTAQTLFLPVLYEGAAEKEFTWQSTGGTDAYEPKTSLVPLLIGTLKGTFWALVFTVPLAIAGALYTARFLHGRAREFVKPFVELLAGIPSVILGFVGARYIAPAIEERMIALFLVPVALLGFSLIVGILWARLPLRVRRRWSENRVPFLLVPAYALIAWVFFQNGAALEESLLGMSFRQWAPQALDLPFEQRNSVVVGLAMGFAVAPLIFTLAEDAYRNVPSRLSDASLALGATPWQTAVRVIEPPARPGVIAAVMLGFGRAVGETMIVLMATGNTPIMDWNPLQGFRTLSANLATELPEAPHGESLYRILFLSAVLLFGLTFMVNSLAEIIRVRGRKVL